MRMWMVDPEKMCRKHLMGEHVELHMLIGSLQKKKSLSGFVDKGLIEPESIWERHHKLHVEMLMRDYSHNSSLPPRGTLLDYLTERVRTAVVDTTVALADLQQRCAQCRELSK